MIGTPSDTPQKKTYPSLCQWASVADSFLVTCVHLLLPAETLSALNLAGLLRAAPVCVWMHTRTVVAGVLCAAPVCSYVHQACCIWRPLFPWGDLYPLALTVFLPPLLHRSLNPEGRRGLMTTSHLELSAPSLSLYIVQWWSSTLIPVHYKRKLL